MPLRFISRCRKLLRNGLKWGVKRPLVGVVALFLLVLAATWFITAQRLAVEQEMANRNSRSHQESLALIISEHLSQVLDRGALLARASAEWFDGGNQQARGRLSAMLSADRAFLRLALYDLQAKRVYASSSSTDSEPLIQAVQTALSDAQAANTAHVYFGPVSSSLEKALQVPLLYPVADNSGKTRGVFLVVLDLGYLLGLYQDIEIGRTGAIQILRSSGEEIARARHGGLELSQTPWPKSRIAFAVGSQGSLVTDLFDDGQRYQTSFKQLLSYPFLVVVSRNLEEMHVVGAD